MIVLCFFFCLIYCVNGAQMVHWWWFNSWLFNFGLTIHLSPIHSGVFAWKIYAARRDCDLIDFNSFWSFNGCLMTKNLHKSIKFEDRYYIFYISSEYIDLWRFFVIKHSLKYKNELKSIKYQSLLAAYICQANTTLWIGLYCT